MDEWEEVRCAVCMDHPHNAVLLTCSSGHKGCQPFMCDTSYRHSNCLDQYKKASNGSLSPEENASNQEQSKLLCPLCRGEVTGWKVVETARRYMNSIVRSCSKESCGYTGCYAELRLHAREEHPLVRPSEADPERQRDWRMMEQRRDIGDLFSTIQSAMGGEDGRVGSVIEEDEELGMRSIFRISSMAVFFIFSFTSSGGGGTARGRTSIGSSRTPARVTSRSRRGEASLLWGETYSDPHVDEMVVSGANIDENDDDVDMVNDDEVDNDDAYEYGDSDYGGSNSGWASETASSPIPARRGPRRPRRRLRVSDDEMDDDNGDTL